MMKYVQSSGITALGKYVLVGGTLAVMLAGCSTTVYRESFGDITTRNKITVAETVERLEMYVGPNGLNLSARDQDAVDNFIIQYSRTAEGPLYVNIPGAAAQGAGVRQAQSVITSRLQSLGLPPQALQVGQYASRDGAPAPIVLSYRRLTTEPIECQQGSSLTHTSNNQPYGGFGCAQTANLAAMIADPRQLLSPYDLANGPADRRTLVLDGYSTAGTTATPRPADQEVSATSGTGG
jgi:pilus assembly protein CpaD